MPDSKYTETKNATLDGRADMEDDQSILIKEAKQAEIAGDKAGAAELIEEANAIGGELIATAETDQQIVDISDEAEFIDSQLAPGQPNQNAGKPGFTKTGKRKI